jgi:predicted SAM-dependent methyltransferase
MAKIIDKLQSLSYRLIGPLRLRRFIASHGCPILLNVGAGHNVLTGWLNTDYDRKSGCVFLDITKRLPFQDSSVSVILAEHVIQALPKSGSTRFFHEAFRCLCPGGILRVSTPNLTALCRALCEPSLEKLRESLVQRHKRITGKNEVVVSYCDFFNDMNHMWDLHYLFSEEELYCQLREIGFQDIRRATFGQSLDERLCNVEIRPEPEIFEYANLIVEAIRNE